LDLEGAEEAVDEAEVLEGVEDVDGLGLEARLDLRRPAFVPIAKELFPIGGACLVFRQDALIAVPL